MTIYERQMKKLGLTIEQYAKLTEIPVDILKKLLKNEGVSENMGLNDFFRKNTVELHDKLESDIDNTIQKSNEIIIDDNVKKMQEDSKILEWYTKTYSRGKLLKATNCTTTRAFENNYKITLGGKRATRWFYNSIINQGGKEIATDKIIEFAKQLYDILENGNLAKYRDYQYKNNDSHVAKDKYQEWFKNYDIRGFAKKHNITQKQGCKELEMAESSYHNMLGGSYFPSAKVIQKVQKWVEKYENKSISELENKKEENIENNNVINATYQMINENSDEMLKKLLITRLTDEEKYLIKLFGGKID